MIRVSAATAATLVDMQTGLDGISALLEQLSAKLQVLEGEWNGEAREAYALAQRQWNESMARLNALVASARGRAQRHAEDVGTFDSRRSSAWIR